MQLKPSVCLADLTPQMVLAAVVAREVYRRLDSRCSCTITSANDSKHSEASWHYKGRALDFRTHDFNGDKRELLNALRAALGPEFDVVLEGEGTSNEHIHLEWDPK